MAVITLSLTECNYLTGNCTLSMTTCNSGPDVIRDYVIAPFGMDYVIAPFGMDYVIAPFGMGGSAGHRLVRDIMCWGE